MAKYFYIARSFKGESKTGNLEARDERELAKLLKQDGYFLVSATLEGESPKKRKFKISLSFLRRVGLKEKIFFTRNLRIMITSGLPFPQSLKILSEQSKNKKFKNALEDIRNKILKGKNFSEALSFHTDIFSEFFQNMIKVAEEAGTMEEVLKILTEQMEKEDELRNKIKGAMIYPSVIILAMIGIGILMLVVVVPVLAETFDELEIELPATTRFIVFLGTFLAAKWYLGVLLIIILLILIKAVLKTKKGKRTIDNLTLKIPIISSIVKKTNSAYTARILSSLIAAGVPIVRSLEILARALGNVYFRTAVAEAAEKVKKGEKLASAIKPYENIYPSLVSQMIEVGEETGETSAILAKLADFYEEEVANFTKNLSAVIEPVLMIIVGAVVGFFAISMIQPIYSMIAAF